MSAATGQDDSPAEGLTVEGQTTLIRNTTVAAATAGIVRQVNVREGDRPEADQTLIVLDEIEINAEHAAAKSAWEAARIESENDIDIRYAERTLDVQRRELAQSESANRQFGGSVSGTEIERLKLLVDQAVLAIERARHDRRVAAAKAKEKEAAVRLAAARLAHHRIRSPHGGMVAERTVEPGEWVEPGKPLLRLINLDPIRVECFVDADDATKASHQPGGLHGAAATFRLNGQGEDSNDSVTLRGTVSFVSPETHPVTGQTRLWATLANPDGRVRAGVRGRLTILPTSDRDKLTTRPR